MNYYNHNLIKGNNTPLNQLYQFQQQLQQPQLQTTQLQPAQLQQLQQHLQQLQQQPQLQQPQFQQLHLQQLQQLQQQQLQQQQQIKQFQLQQLQQHQLLNNSKLKSFPYQTNAVATNSTAAAAALQANSVAAKNAALQQIKQQQQPLIAQQFQQQHLTYVMKKQEWHPQRQIYLQELIKILSEIFTNKNEVPNVAKNLEIKIFDKATTIEEYKAGMNQQLLKFKTMKTSNSQIKVQQPATLATQHTTPQMPTGIVTNKVNNNVLLQNPAGLTKTINNTVSPNINTAKLTAAASTTAASLQTGQQITQSVAVNNAMIQNQTQAIQQQQQKAQVQAQVAQTQPSQAAVQSALQNQTVTQAVNTPQPPSPELKKLLENCYRLAVNLKNLPLNTKEPKTKVHFDNMVKLVQDEYEKYERRNEGIKLSKDVLEKIELNLKKYYAAALGQQYKLMQQQQQQKVNAAAAAGVNGIANSTPGLNNVSIIQERNQIQQQQQQQQQLKSQLANKTQVATQATAVNNVAAEVKREVIKPETVNKTPITQPKPLNTETIKTEPKNLKTSSTEVFEDKSEIEKISNKTTSSSSTKKRNNRKTTPSSSVSSINMSSKKSESSSVIDLSSKKGANASKESVRLEKESNSFLGKVDRNINIFALESKNFKARVKSNSKLRSIVQNSFKYIIEPSRPVYGINSCAEEISSLCFNKNENESKSKPIRFENINESPNDHISLFEDIINRKSHITSNIDNANKKGLEQSNKLDNGSDSNKRKFEEITDVDDDNLNNTNKKVNVNDKYSNIVEEITFLKDKYKINVNILDLSSITLILKDKENKSCEVPWDEFTTMINTIKKEESETHQNEHNILNSQTGLSDYYSSSLSSEKAYSNQKTNNERVMLVLSLNLSNYIDTNEAENEYNIPEDNQNNIVIYARIPKSTERYSHQGIFDWNLSYTKKKSIFQTSDEDNKLKEKKIYDFVSHKIHELDVETQSEDVNEDTTTATTTTTTNVPIQTKNESKSNSSTKVIKLWHIVEWIVEGIKS